MSADLLSLFTATFVTFFVLIDALGVAPVFATLTAGGDAAYRRRMAVKSIIVATIIIYGFAFGGSWLLGAMHISIDAFRAAGGILLFIIALDMVFEKRTERREHRAEEHLGTHAADPEPDDISVFPLGIPMVAGPGSVIQLPGACGYHLQVIIFLASDEYFLQMPALIAYRFNKYRPA